MFTKKKTKDDVGNIIAHNNGAYLVTASAKVEVQVQIYFKKSHSPFFLPLTWKSIKF